MPYKVVHNFEICDGCEECVKACAQNHFGLSNCNIFKVGDKFYYFSCMHCKKPQCGAACPVGAISIKDGVVTFNMELCVGCRNCVEACPWGVPKFNFNTGTINKCDLCYDRIIKGEMPFCVSACPNKALELKKIEPKPKPKPQAKPQAKPKEGSS